MSSLSQGPYNYNRFAAIDQLRQQEMQYFTEKAKAKKAKPDFLDVDGDGDKKESFKKGLKDKENGGDKKDDKKEGKGGLPDFIKKKIADKKQMKEGKCSAGCDCDDCKKSKKKEMKEQTIQEKVMDYFVENGYVTNTVSAEVLLHNASEGWLNSIANEIEG